MTMKFYLLRVRRQLWLPAEVKKRVLADLESDIRSRREAGSSDAQIMQELGTPASLAGELNTQMDAYTYKKSPWRWLCLVVAAVGIGLLLLQINPSWVLTQVFQAVSGSSASYGIIGGADGPTAIFVTAGPRTVEDYILPGVLVIMCLVGYWRLSHLKKNTP